MRSITILGPGLIGGSLGLALRDRQPGTEIRVWTRREASRSEVEDRGFAAFITSNLEAAVRGADLIVLCVPVDRMASVARGMVNFVGPEAVLTDAGSVKQSVVADLEPIFGDRFVGAHPIAGSERSGLAAARADLFEAAPCVLTPTAQSDPAAIGAVTDFWESVGCLVSTLSPADHDDALARTSHLPHLAASALVAAVASGSPDALSLVGPGFRDCTRVAMGDAELWAGILLANRTAVASSVAELREILQNVETMLTTGDEESLRHFLKTAADTRLAAPVPPIHAVQGQ